MECAIVRHCSKDNAEHDVLADMSFPEEHRAKLQSTTPIERLNGEIKRRTNAPTTRPSSVWSAP